MPKLCLTSEIVGGISAPERGEVWIGDNHLEYFGVRAWAGKKGGGKAFAIRLRDQFGILVRESYQPERDFPLYAWEHAWNWPLGSFLKHARGWARDRIAIHRGEPTSKDRRHRQWQRRKARVLATRIGDAFDQRIKRLRRASNDHLYVDHIDKLVNMHVPCSVRDTTFRDVPIRRLADAISHRSISYGNVKVLRAFVGGVFEQVDKSYPVLRYKLESIQRRCAKNLAARLAPPHPRILDISEEDYQRFFANVEMDACWRQALAMRFYFATGARLQVVLRARWSDFLEGIWYMFLPEERKLWFESRERLGEESLQVLELIEKRHRAEGLTSPYLFPSADDSAKPIRTLQRHWARYSDKFGWNGLPLSHVVLRHRRRSNPSYSLFFLRTYWEFGRDESLAAVSKVSNRRRNNEVIATIYKLEHCPV